MAGAGRITTRRVRNAWQTVGFPIGMLAMNLWVPLGLALFAAWGATAVAGVGRRRPRPNDPEHDERWHTLYRDTLAIAYVLVFVAAAAYFFAFPKRHPFELTGFIVVGGVLACLVASMFIVWMRER